MADFTVGQEVFVVLNPYRGNLPSRVLRDRVLSVGRKWVCLEGSRRFDKEGMELDGKGYSSPGRVYLSKEAYEEQSLRGKLWREIREVCSNTWQPPKEVSVGELTKILWVLKGCKD